MRYIGECDRHCWFGRGSFIATTINVYSGGNVQTWQYVSAYAPQDWLDVPDIQYLGGVPGSIGAGGSVVAPSNPDTCVSDCLSQFYNSNIGTATQFIAPTSLIPGWNPNYKENIGKWLEAIVGKGGGLLGSGAVHGTGEITSLSGTTAVKSTIESVLGRGLGLLEEAAKPAAIMLTVGDIGAHQGCLQQAYGLPVHAGLVRH